MNESVNHEAVCRKAPATPGLSNMLLKVDLQIERAVEKGWQYEGTDDPLSLL